MDCMFRQLTPADADLALAMNDTFREGFFTLDSVSAFLADERNWLFAAIRDDSIVGFACGYELLHHAGNRMLYIHEIGIAEAFQRQGIGTALIAALKAACRDRGITRFFLFTAQNNIAANALYRKTGGETSWDSHGHDTAYFFPIR